MQRATFRMMYLASITLVSGALDERLGIQVDLALAAGGDLVIVRRGRDPALGHPLGHLGAEVGEGVGGEGGK